MTTVRKVIDSSALADLFELPPAFKNRKVEVVLFPVDEPEGASASVSPKNTLLLTMAQIEEWAKAPEVQALLGALKGTGLPADISMIGIRNERLAEKYKV